MKCRICGGRQERRITDLPFKTGELSIVIIKSLPVLQCGQCGDAELENDTMAQVDRLLSRTGTAVELEVIRYAA